MGRCLAEGVARLCHLSPLTPAQVLCLPVGLRPLCWVRSLVLALLHLWGWLGGWDAKDAVLDAKGCCSMDATLDAKGCCTVDAILVLWDERRWGRCQAKPRVNGN